MKRTFSVKLLVICIALITILSLAHQYIWHWRKHYDFVCDPGYYAYDIEDIRIQDTVFHFRQVKEVADLENIFYRTYDTYDEIRIDAGNADSNIFDSYAGDFTSGKENVYKWCYLDEDGNTVAASTILVYNKNDDIL